MTFLQAIKALRFLALLALAPGPALALGEADSILAPLLPRLAHGDKDVTAFRDVNVIPIDSTRVLRGQTVIVSGGRIVALGPAGKTVIPTGATVIEGRGRYLIPGLVDMHAHPSVGFPTSARNLVRQRGPGLARPLADRAPIFADHVPVHHRAAIGGA